MINGVSGKPGSDTGPMSGEGSSIEYILHRPIMVTRGMIAATSSKGKVPYRRERRTLVQRLPEICW